MTTITISCEDCSMRDTSACDECVVTFLCDREEGGPLVIDELEGQALRLLGGAGLIPPLRHAPVRSAAPPGSRHATPRRPSRATARGGSRGEGLGNW